MTNKPSVVVVYVERFLYEISRLQRKYPRIQQDIDPLHEQLQRGELPGAIHAKVERDDIDAATIRQLIAFFNADDDSPPNDTVPDPIESDKTIPPDLEA